MEALTPVDVLSLVVVGVQVSCLAYEGAVMGVVAKGVYYLAGVTSPHFDDSKVDDVVPQQFLVMELWIAGY